MQGRLFFKSLILFLVGVIWLVSALSVHAIDVKPDISQALSSGDTATAVALLNQEVEADPGHYLNYYALGMIAFERRDFAQARTQFELAVDKKSKHWESVYHLGLCLVEVGELDEAEKVMGKGLKKAKNMKADFENGMGLVLMAKEQYLEAGHSFRRALAESEVQEEKKLKDLKTQRFERDEDRDAAIAEMKAVSIHSQAEYHINLGDASFYQGVAPLAVLEYAKALEVDTASLEVYFHWAEACIKMKDYNCAMEKLQLVLSRDSTHAPAWMRAGGIYYKAARSSSTAADRKSRFEKTLGSYRKYIELSGVQPDSGTVRIYFELAMAYLHLNGFQDAAENFDLVLAIPIVPRDIYFYYGKALWGAQDYEKSGEMLNQHMAWVKEQEEIDQDFRSGVRDVELYQLLGDGYYYSKPNDFNQAARYYKKSLQERSGQKRILQNLAVCYHSSKNYPEALRYYQERIDLGIDEKSASIYKNAGYCALNIANDAGEADEEENIDELDEGDGAASEPAIDPNLDYYQVAVDYMVKYLEFKPDDTKALLLVGNTSLFQLADCANGVKYLTELLTADPKNCVGKRSLGYAYFGGTCTKKYGTAIRYLKDAYTCVSNESGACSDVDLVLWIAQCYHLRAADKAGRKEDANDDFKNAFEWYGKVLKCEPGHSVAKKGQDDTRFEFVDK